MRKPKSAEAKVNLKGRVSGMRGKHHSEETKKKMSSIQLKRGSKNGESIKGKTWKLVDDKRVWMEKY